MRRKKYYFYPFASSHIEYRIAQIPFSRPAKHKEHEAFTNIVKHAKAANIDLLIFMEDKIMFIVIKDDGIGIKNNKNKTLGIYNMKERINKFGGVLEIESNEGGTEITISIPI